MNDYEEQIEVQLRKFYSDAIVNVYSLALCPTPSIAVISLWQLHVDLMPTSNEFNQVLPNLFENCVSRGTQRAGQHLITLNDGSASPVIIRLKQLVVLLSNSDGNW